MTSPPSSDVSPARAQRPLYATLARRVVVAIAITILLVIPSVVMLAITHESAATWATAAGIGSVVAVAAGGVEVGVMTAVVMAILTPVSIGAGGTPITGAALMALMCLTVGRLSRFGLQGATLLVPIFMAWMIIDPPFWGPQHTVNRADGGYLAWMAVIFFVGAIVPVIVLPFALRKLNLPTPKPHSRREAVPYTATITVLTTAGTFVVLQNPKQFVAGAWLIATILVLAQVGDVDTVRRTIGRVLGTLLGMLVVAGTVLWVHSLAAVYAIGIVFAVAAIAAKFSPHYWVYMALITPTVVLLNASSSTEVANLGEQRAVDTLLGAALVLLAAAITIGYSRWEKQHGHGPTTREPVVVGS
ncbi:MAG: FUSC family protein [Actinomycetes bacterium]